MDPGSKLLCLVALLPVTFAQTPPAPPSDSPAPPSVDVMADVDPHPDTAVPDPMALIPAPVIAAPPAASPAPATSPTAAKRLFGVIPNYRTDQYQQTYTPITARQKFAIARSDSFDWPNYFLLAGNAVQAQVASKGFTHNGSIEGFGEFYARAFADQIIGCYLTEAILPSLLHEDPRFFRLGTGSFLHRASHAATSVLVVRTDDGRSRIAISELAGNAGVVALTTLYYPDSQSAGGAAERWGMQIGNDMISNFLAEFWPDIKKRLPILKHHTGAPTT